LIINTLTENIDICCMILNGSA